MANLAQIEKYLQEKNFKYKLVSLRSSQPKTDAGLKVVALGAPIFTVDEVRKSGAAEGEIVKTLIIRTNDEFVALAIRGEDRVDFKKVRRLFGSKSELAKPEEVEQVAGVPVGAVCPILLDIPLSFDQRVMNLKHVNMGSGDLTRGLEMDFKDLLEAVGRHEIADLTNAP